MSSYIFAIKERIDNRKKLVKQQYLSTCPHNTVNFGPLTAEIGSGIWGTPANFNGFRVLACVTARHSSSGRQPNFAALNRRRHLQYIQQGSHHVGHWFTLYLCYVLFSFTPCNGSYFKVDYCVHCCSVRWSIDRGQMCFRFHPLRFHTSTPSFRQNCMPRAGKLIYLPVRSGCYRKRRQLSRNDADGCDRQVSC